MKPAELIRTAREAVGELTGFTPENVTGFERDGDGWIVTVEVLELERVPSTTDVLGSYEITVGEDGEIQAFHRRRRYARGSAERED